MFGDFLKINCKYFLHVVTNSPIRCWWFFIKNYKYLSTESLFVDELINYFKKVILPIDHGKIFVEVVSSTEKEYSLSLKFPKIVTKDETYFLNIEYYNSFSEVKIRVDKFYPNKQNLSTEVRNLL